MEVTVVDLGAVQHQPRRPKIQQHMTGLVVLFLKIQTSVQLALPTLSNCSSCVLQGLRIVRQAIQTFIRLTSVNAGYITRYTSTSARWIPSRVLRSISSSRIFEDPSSQKASPLVEATLVVDGSNAHCPRTKNGQSPPRPGQEYRPLPGEKREKERLQKLIVDLMDGKGRHCWLLL